MRRILIAAAVGLVLSACGKDLETLEKERETAIQAILVRELPTRSPRFKAWLGKGQEYTLDISRMPEEKYKEDLEYFRSLDPKKRPDAPKLVEAYSAAKPGDLLLVNLWPVHGPTDSDINCVVNLKAGTLVSAYQHME